MTPPYVSPLREAQAAQTRARVLDAAAQVFGERGFAGTSLARVAEQAGVSLETVKQNGPKSALLLAAFEQKFSGAEGEHPLRRRELLDEAEGVALDHVVPVVVDIVIAANARVASLWPRLLEAADSDADVARRLRQLQEDRRAEMQGAVAFFRSKGLCRGEKPDTARAEALSFLISPESYTQLVEEARWSTGAYSEWLVRAVERMVLEG